LARYTYQWQDTPHGRRVARVEIKSELEGLKKDELVAQAEKRGLDTSGTKADLIERLRDE
jgi:hypothetical protein